jgi:hypothetical protein
VTDDDNYCTGFTHVDKSGSDHDHHVGTVMSTRVENAG